MDENKNGAHQTHCCKRHGCKYDYTGYAGCPVVDATVQQEYACEECLSASTLQAKIAELQEELAWTCTLEARGLKVTNTEIW